jgi:hypothetical protein
MTLPPPPVPLFTTVVQVFTVSGTYMPSPGLVSLTVECTGGGGAGGATPPLSNFALAGGGGGSGGYSRKTLPAALVLGGVIVTVGTGGVASSLEDDVDGHPTSFGALCVANGGHHGVDNNTTDAFGDGGVEAFPGIGDIALAGGGGFAGLLVNAPFIGALMGGHGGSIFGGARNLNIGVGNIYPGASGYPGSGAGGSGAVCNQAASGTTQLGGNGRSGLCVVTEFCWANAGGGSGCVNVPACPPGQWGME